MKREWQEVAPKDLELLERFLKEKNPKELENLLYLTQNLQRSPQLELLADLAPKTKIRKRPMIRSRVSIPQAFDEEMLAVIKNAKESNAYNFAEAAPKQGEEAMENDMSAEEADAAQEEAARLRKAEKNARRRARRTEKKRQVVAEEKQSVIDEKRENLRVARAKEKEVKNRIAKERARPVVEDESKGNQIGYLRTGGLTPTEVERVKNWMTTWSKENVKRLYSSLRQVSSERDLETKMKILSNEALLRGF